MGVEGLAQDGDGRWVLKEALVGWADEREGDSWDREESCRFVCLCPFLGEFGYVRFCPGDEWAEESEGSDCFRYENLQGFFVLEMVTSDDLGGFLCFLEDSVYGVLHVAVWCGVEA